MRESKSFSAWPQTRVQALSHLPLLCSPSVTASSVLLPALYEPFSNPGSASSPENLSALLLLLLAKRVVLYATATTTVYVAARRSIDVERGLGERLEAITAAAVEPLVLPQAQAAEVREVARSLDSTSAASQAAAIPVLFALLLASAYAINVLLLPGIEVATAEAPVRDLDMAVVFRAFQPISAATVCFFSANIEAQAAGRALVGGSGAASKAVACVCAALAACSVGVCYATPPAASWPVQNAVNSAIAICVARALQLPSLPAVLAALAGLVLYDGVGTLASAASAAGAEAAGAAAGGGGSLMEAVAGARFGAFGGAAGWQPGLLVVSLEGRLTDGLGLGDVVAPSMLAGWAHRFDERKRCAARAAADGSGGESSGGESSGVDRDGGRPRRPGYSPGYSAGYLGVALRGYAAGCVALEVAPAELTRAALLFLVPCTAAGVLGALAVRGDLDEAWRGT